MKLTEDQLQAREDIIYWFKSSDNIAYCLKGYAGTGKTTLVNYIFEDEVFKYTNRILCAPTHRAASVLSSKTGLNVSTLHSFLGYGPNVNLAHFNPARPEFAPIKKDKFQRRALIVVDEASMINRKLFEHLVKKAGELECRILFVGDPAQIPPVNENVSVVFTDIDGSELRTIVRTEDTNILKCCSYLRDNLFTANLDFSPFDNGKSFKILPYSEIVEVIKQLHFDNIHFKYVAFHDKVVHSVNKRIRDLVTNNAEEPIVPGDILTAYIGGVAVRDGKSHSGYINSLDVRVNQVSPLGAVGPSHVSLPGYSLHCSALGDLKSSIRGDIPMDVVSKSGQAKFLKHYSNLVSIAKASTGSTRARLWENALSFRSSYLLLQDAPRYKRTIDYGYALTSHKCQGTTVETVIVDLPNFNSCQDIWFRNRMLYTSIGRASHNVILVK